MSSWEKLARKNKFVYDPGDLFQRESITGLYRGYRLRMSHWYSGVEIILSTEEADKPPDAFAKPVWLPKRVSRLITSRRLINIAQGYLRLEQFGHKVFYHHLETTRTLRSDTKHFQLMIDLLCDLGNNYRKMLALGGEAVLLVRKEAAGKPELSPFARQLLQDIGRDTTERLGGHTSHLLCPYCLTRFQAHKVDIPGAMEKLDVTYVGCRICQQSRNLLECKTVVAKLDRQKEGGEKQFKGQTLHVNWLVQRKLFDFDQVDILQATDEDVERFAVQIGNDTDPIRPRHYSQMCCTVSPSCNLAENTMRILRSVFGEVQVTSV